MNYPTKQEVIDADREQICRWFRFLPSPNKEEEIINEMLMDKFGEFGGFTPAISKKIGWKE